MRQLPREIEMRLRVEPVEDDPSLCRHAETEMRRRVYRNGTIVFQRQCLTCGVGAGGPVAKSTVQGMPPDFDEAAAERYRDGWDKRYERRRQAQRDEFFACYDAYLQTNEWRQRRAAVLARDSHVCQGCGGRASQVHHLSYAHVGTEFLFELTSLCRDCHERLHKP